MGTRALAIAICLIALGCAPGYHRVQSYRHSHVKAAAVEAEAEQMCRAVPEPRPMPKRTFVTDGCTLWIDGWWTGRSWQKCCVAHDAAYWCGGTKEMRDEADRRLRECVAAEYAPWMGMVMLSGAKVFGHPWLPTHWRWGYGHDYPAPY